MLFTYLLFSAGVSYSMHFCGDTLASTEFFATNKGCACTSKDKKPYDCCKDVKVESAKDDHKAASLYKVTIDKVVLAEIKFFVIEFIKLSGESSNNSNQDYSSPPFYKVPKFIFNQIFRL